MIAVPQPTIERLVVYYRYLRKKSQYDEIKVVSSLQIGKNVGVSAANVRKDLSYFGEFGRKGVGYNVNNLLKRLEKILGFNKFWPIILVGTGNLGRALINYQGFEDMGFKIVAAFDCDLNKIGNRIGKITVKSVKELETIINKKRIRLAILTIPGEEAQNVVDKLVKAGIKAIWNFAPVPLDVKEEITVISQDLSSDVASMIYRLNGNHE